MGCSRYIKKLNRYCEMGVEGKTIKTILGNKREKIETIPVTTNIDKRTPPVRFQLPLIASIGPLFP